MFPNSCVNLKNLIKRIIIKNINQMVYVCILLVYSIKHLNTTDRSVKLILITLLNSIMYYPSFYS